MFAILKLLEKLVDCVVGVILMMMCLPFYCFYKVVDVGFRGYGQLYPQSKYAAYWNERHRIIRNLLFPPRHAKRSEASKSREATPELVPSSSLTQWPWNRRLYVPLNCAGRGVRLLFLLRDESREVTCRMQNFENLDDCPPFVALSYTWGDARSENQEITMNGHKTRVRENLFSFLGHLKHATSSWTSQVDSSPDVGRWARGMDYSGPLWIDTICINQSSVTEKTEQVSLMSQIYEQASFVIVWIPPALLDGTRDSEHGLDHEKVSSMFRLRNIMDMRRLRDAEDREAVRFYRGRDIERERAKTDVKEEEEGMVYKELYGETWLKFSAFVRHVVDDPYWQRVWIIQEITLAKAILVCSGNDAVAWNNFRTFYAHTHSSSSPTGSIFKLIEQRSVASGHEEPDINIQVSTHQNDDLTSYKNNQCLPEVIQKFWSSQCTDPRDRVFGLIGLDAQAKISADYSLSEEELLLLMARSYRNFYCSERRFYDLATSLRIDDAKALRLFVDTFGIHKLKSPALRSINTRDTNQEDSAHTGLKKKSRLDQIIQRQNAWNKIAHRA